MKRLLFLIVLLSVLGFAAFTYIKNASVEVQNDIITAIDNKTAQKKQTDLSKLVKQEISIPPPLNSRGPTQNRILELPEEFNISVFAGGFQAPRALTFDNSGGVYFSDKEAGRVYFLKDPNDDNVADTAKLVDENLRSVHGVAYFNKELFVAEEHQIVVYREINEEKYVKKEILVSELPTGGHTTRTLKIGPDKKLYVSIGSSCNICEEQDNRRAAIIRYNLDGTGQVFLASGLRNTVDFIFDENLKIWGVDNGRDNLGDNSPPEEVNIIQTGKHYGWPYCYGNKIANPEYIERQGFCEDATTEAEYELQAHSAPLGLTFAPWKDLDKHLFVTMHGSWNRSEPTGYKVVSINTAAINGKDVDFIRGWLETNGEAWGRPVDIKPYKGDRLLITDDRAGVIYIVTRK